MLLCQAHGSAQLGPQPPCGREPVPPYPGLDDSPIVKFWSESWAHLTIIVVGPQSFTLMPWPGFSRKTEDELTAIYAYLRTVPSVRTSSSVNLRSSARPCWMNISRKRLASPA